MVLMNREEIAQHLLLLDGWSDEGGSIAKRFAFVGFPEAAAFVSRLVPGAEAADHHPDIAINYRHVTVSYSTHSEGGVTLKDIDGAREADRQSHESS